MEWIDVSENSEVPTDKNIIVEDSNGWIGQAHFDGQDFVLETFGQVSFSIEFAKIVRYIII